MTNQSNQEKLDEMYEMVQENNQILRSLLRRERIANFMRIVYWLFLLSAIFGTYYYVQPFFQSLDIDLSVIQNTLNFFKGYTSKVNIPEAETLKSAIETFKSATQ